MMTKRLGVNIAIIALCIVAIVLLGYPFYHIKDGTFLPSGNPVGYTVMHNRWHAGFIFMWLTIALYCFICCVCMLRIFTDFVSYRANCMIKVVAATLLVIFTTIICFCNYSITALDLSHIRCGWAIYWFACISGINAILLASTYKL